MKLFTENKVEDDRNGVNCALFNYMFGRKYTEDNNECRWDYIYLIDKKRWYCSRKHSGSLLSTKDGDPKAIHDKHAENLSNFNGSIVGTTVEKYGDGNSFYLKWDKSSKYSQIYSPVDKEHCNKVKPCLVKIFKEVVGFKDEDSSKGKNGLDLYKIVDGLIESWVNKIFNPSKPEDSLADLNLAFDDVRKKCKSKDKKGESKEFTLSASDRDGQGRKDKEDGLGRSKHPEPESEGLGDEG